MVNRTNLVKNHVADAASKPARQPKGIAVAAGRKGCDDKCPQVGVQFVRRNDYTGAGFPDLGAAEKRRVKSSHFTVTGYD